jgi:hypothetical protein
VASDNAEVRFIFICHHPCLRDRLQHISDHVVSSRATSSGTRSVWRRCSRPPRTR